jgi:hypothetical protein
MEDRSSRSALNPALALYFIECTSRLNMFQIEVRYLNEICIMYRCFGLRLTIFRENKRLQFEMSCCCSVYFPNKLLL